jgi:hypothetical protein
MKPSMALKNQNKNGKLKKNGKPKMRLWKKLLLGFLATLSVCGLIFAYGTVVLNQTEDAFKSTFSDLGLSSSKKSDDIIKATKPLTILLMGLTRVMLRVQIYGLVSRIR